MTVDDILDGFAFFIDNAHTVNAKQEEDLNSAAEVELNKEVVDINSIDIMSLINSAVNNKSVDSTEAESVTHPLITKCELGGRINNKIFLDFNKHTNSL